MIELNGTSIVLAISFVIFVILLNFLFYKPMKKVMEERAKYIQDNKNDADTDNSKTQKLIEEKNTKIAEAKKQSFDHLNQTFANELLSPPPYHRAIKSRRQPRQCFDQSWDK